MSFEATLAERVRHPLARKKGFVEKRMFGGLAFLRHGNMCVGVWKESLILRLGTTQAEKALEHFFVREFDITGRPMTGWVMIDHADLQNDDELADWIAQAIRFVRTLPRKAK